MSVHRCMIVPLAKVERARFLAEALAGTAGAHMWLTPLSATGSLPATHYISTGPISEEMALLMESPAVLYGACQQAGLPDTLAEITALLAASDVSESEPFPRLEELGLRIINEGEA